VEATNDHPALTKQLLLSGCGKSEVEQLREENQELHEQVDHLQSQLVDIKEKSENLEAASNSLQEQLGRFQNENWRDVVDDAQGAGAEVEQAQQDLSDATDE